MKRRRDLEKVKMRSGELNLRVGSLKLIVGSANIRVWKPSIQEDLMERGLLSEDDVWICEEKGWTTEDDGAKLEEAGG